MFLCFCMRIESGAVHVVLFADLTQKEYKMQPERTAFCIS